MKRAVRWQCGRCGERFSAWAAAERHADENVHNRIELLLTSASTK